MFIKIRRSLLATFSFYVKAFLTLSVTLCLFTESIAEKREVITLGIGEQLEITLPSINKISLGNREVIKLKKISSGAMIKGLRVGYSDLILWNKKKHYFNVYVYSKKNQLKRIQLQRQLQPIGVSSSIEGNISILRGKLDNIEDYYSFHKIIRNYKNIDSKVHLTHNLERNIFHLILKEMSTAHQIPYCFTIKSKVHCQLEQSFSEDKLKFIEDNYQVNFVRHHSKELTYKIQLNLIHFQSNQDIPINRKNSHEIIKQSMTDKIPQLNASYFLANPTLYLKDQEDSTISLGEENPYTSYSNNKKTTNWRFSGLKIKINLKAINNKVLLKNNIQLKLPKSEGDQKFNHQSTSVFDLDQHQVLFQMNLNEAIHSNTQISIVKNIPFLRSLLKSKANQYQYSKLVGVIKIMVSH